jgi:3-phenylpropionate/trans-cinnamate dioxygenase ferredoxin reductase component
MLGTVVIVGASLAGMHAAHTLRKEGFDGTITVVGDEPHEPYDRPPLSKQVLSGEWDTDRIALPADDEGLDLDWRLGARASGLDLTNRAVKLMGGEVVGYDGLVIATGAQARWIPGADALEGIHVLRSLDDCVAIRTALDEAPQRVVVVGAGFIGSEVAAVCRGRGLDVTVVEAAPVPLERALGARMGDVCAQLHRDEGVDLRLGVGVDGFDGNRRVESVNLSDGTRLEADVVVIGVGVRPATEWLETSGLELDDGVVCDETCLAAPGVVAAGDVARWPSRRFGEMLRVEHWENAVQQGEAAARTLLAGAAGGETYDPIPWFWSDQYDRKIQLAGRSGPDDDVEVVIGSVDERRFVALYGRAGRVVGVLGMNRPRHVMQLRQSVIEGASWEDAIVAARELA